MSAEKKLPDTSLAANRAATVEMRNGHYAKIISALKSIGSGTYEEIANFIGLDRHAVGRRLGEMEGMQIVWKPGAKKNTKSGRLAYVYQLTGQSQPKTENEIIYRKGEKSATDFAKEITKLTGSATVVQTLF